ncbi:ComC/BlpC family leader-containing pheromone/bacteriocin [Priestia filamentosa]|uniref:ComC/BlpC family leader-containing pheromone/bacteriocin n=1 Tax=Priestia filamentosa TaxID=1402861 RepID=UPI003982AA23
METKDLLTEFEELSTEELLTIDGGKTSGDFSTAMGKMVGYFISDSVSPRSLLNMKIIGIY